jgi:hypothetical protein
LRGAGDRPPTALSRVARLLAVVSGWLETTGEPLVSTRRVHIMVLATLPVAVAGCVPFEEPIGSLAVWSEFLSPNDVRREVPVLAEYDADLYLAVRPDDLGDDLAELMRDAAASGVIVRPWLQLPGDGIWLNEENARAFADFTWSFLAWARDSDAPVEWIIFDLEPSYDYAQQLREAAEANGLGSVVELLLSHADAGEFEAARQVIGDLVGQLHGMNVKAMAVTLPWTIDDLDDADADLQDLFDTPLAGIDWDAVSVIVYRPVFSELLGIRLPPGYVASYARSMVMRFGDRGQVAVGNISTPGYLLPPGYDDPSGIVRDVAAARSAGANDVSVYSLDGMVLTGATEAWLAAASTKLRGPPVGDPVTALIRGALHLFDAVINP